MPRERRGERVLGPHFIAERNGWRLTYVYADGSRSSSPIFPSKEEAKREKQRLLKELSERSSITISEAIEKYEEHLRDIKGNKGNSIDQTVRRMRSFFLS